MYQRLFTLALFILGNYAQVVAQDYTVSSKIQRINNTKYNGFSIKVDGSFSKVADQTYTYLKAKSKLRRKRNYYSVAELKMDKVQLDSTIIYLKIEEKASQTLVWLGVKTTGLKQERINTIEKGLQEELIHIARSFYVHEQELKILEAETAAQVISKAHQSLIGEKSKLATSLEEKEARKIELEELLETNRLNIEVLKQKLIDNKFAQDSVYLDLQKVNKVIEVQKQKLKEID
ncbi:hypothetical protein MNBD_BACTEROID06-11 [hydrothermal vent metagenome]|uniref:Uncharacterized protein n=1 Tax=hydrothermal vent metagenome TaxID=652676 RepID=A0A3B0UY99_9ZZZZ